MSEDQWRRRLHRGLTALVSCALVGSTVASWAAPLPSGLPAVSITARDQPIATFLRDLFSQAGRPVITSPGLTGTVSGQFDGPGDKVFRDVSRAFNLTGYYDGAAFYVYPAGELTSKTFDVGPAGTQKVVRGVSGLGIADAQNFVRPTGSGAVVASGTPRFIDQVGDIARTAGGGGLQSYNPAPAEPRVVPLEFRVFYLRYARAEDTTVYAGGREVRIPGIATIMQSLVLDRRDRPGANSYGVRQVRQSAQRVGGTGLAATPADDTQLPVLGLPPANAVLQQQQLQQQPGYGDQDGGLPPSTSDYVRIEANPTMNAIIVRDAPERMAAYDGLIRALDVEPQLVEIEATIIDINTTKARALGVDFRLGSGGFGALFGNGNATDLQLTPNGFVSRRQNAQDIAPTANGFAISTVIGAQREFLSRISALEQKGAARVVSRPQVMTLSNVEAVFDRTQTFYVRVAGRQNVDLFNVTAGTTLRVNPSVFRDQGQTRIRVLVGIEDGSLSDVTVDSIPIVDRASVNTQALILEGESLLLGGLTADSDTNTENKIPLLGDIPIIGNVFKKQNKRRDRTERLFLITPRLVSLTSRMTAPVPGSAAATAASAAAAISAPLPKP